MDRGTERERGVEVVERVTEREHRRRVLGRDPVLLGGARVVAGLAQMLSRGRRAPPPERSSASATRRCSSRRRARPVCS